MKKIFLAWVLFLSSASFSMEKIKVNNVWIKLLPSASKVTAAFGEIENHSKDKKTLVSVEGDFAETIEIHTHIKENGVMKMRKVKELEIPSHGKLVLEPGGDHIMIFGLKKPLKSQEKLKLTLRFKDNSEQIIWAKVLESAPQKPSKHHHHHH